MELRKVLILGSRGMLGRDLAVAFQGTGVLTRWDREELNITNQGAVLKSIGALSPDLIINATGYTDVEGAEEHRELAFGINAEAVSSLVSAAESVGARFVHFSTEYVFDGESKAGYGEDTSVRPLNVYGESKAAGEKFVMAYPKGYLVRTSWLYGHTPQRGKPRGMNFIDTILAKAKAGEPLRVVNDQFGKLTATYDLAQAVRTLVSGVYAPGTYHLVNGGVASWYDVAREAFRLRRVTTPLNSIPSVAYPMKAKRPRYGVLLNAKLPPLRPWQEALHDYLT